MNYFEYEYRTDSLFHHCLIIARYRYFKKNWFDISPLFNSYPYRYDNFSYEGKVTQQKIHYSHNLKIELIK